MLPQVTLQPHQHKQDLCSLYDLQAEVLHMLFVPGAPLLLATDAAGKMLPHAKSGESAFVLLLLDEANGCETAPYHGNSPTALQTQSTEARCCGLFVP